MDRRDVALGYSVFHEDATADYGDALYTGSGHGFIDWVTELHGTFLNHSHQTTNILVELNGDRAVSETYALVGLHRSDGDELTHITSWCRYLDRWSRRGGRWAIDHRMIVLDLSERRAIGSPGSVSRGRRDEGDPSYDLFASIAGDTTAKHGDPR